MYSGSGVAVLLLASLASLQVATKAAILDPSLPEDGQLSFIELAGKYYGKCEQYEVTTEDGYILTLFRLNGSNNSSSVPVLFWHGVLDSSDTFVVRGTNSSGIALANDGYDVWFGNSRGNKYSRRHESLDPNTDKKFWDFSFHEFGYYDLPAAIDFILKETGQKKLSAIGHSQGNSIFYVLGSLRPEYNDKVQVLIAMAPVAILNNLRGLLEALVPVWPVVSTTIGLTGTGEIFQDQSAMNDIIQLICSLGIVGLALCRDGALWATVGEDREELEPEFFEVLLGHYPAGSARKNGDHYYQVASRKRFGQFDYGAIQNLAKYGSTTPPDYKLKNVAMPVAILAAANDNFSTLKDVALLRQGLANVVYYKEMEPEKFNHIDYVVGKSINIVTNPLLKELLQKFA